MSTNWKDIGMNSGNMSQHRNVAANKLNYENGKWILNEDIDARNKQTKTNKKKSPKMGLIK